MRFYTSVTAMPDHGRAEPTSAPCENDQIEPARESAPHYLHQFRKPWQHHTLTSTQRATPQIYNCTTVNAIPTLETKQRREFSHHCSNKFRRKPTKHGGGVEDETLMEVEAGEETLFWREKICHVSSCQWIVKQSTSQILVKDWSNEKDLTTNIVQILIFFYVFKFALQD